MAERSWTTFTDEQRRAAFLVDRPVLAAAGAGAGKTAVMAVRYVACLLSEVDGEPLGPERILAVAFTREAAANLRARIERTLREVLALGRFPRLSDGEGHVERDLPPTSIDHLRRCLGALPGAAIATFDALCLTWVAEHAAELGRDPDLRPQEDLAWAQAREQAWAALTAQQRDGGDLAMLIDAYGREPVRGLVMRLAEQAAALPEPVLAALPGDAVALVRARRAALFAALADALDDAHGLAAKGKVLDTLRALARSAPTDPAALGTWCAALDALSLAGVRDDAVKETVRAIQDAVDFPSQRSGDSRPGKEARVAFASIAALGRWRPADEALFAGRAAAFARLAADWLAHRDRAALRLGQAGFASVEAQALALLERPAARTRLGARYRHLLLDEAQDLNRLQGRIIERIQEGGAPSGSARVFVVGDHRQSIFGFRHAEPAIFARWGAAIGGRGGIEADLKHNFRSHPALLAAVRGVFAQDALVSAFRPQAILAGREAADFPGPGILHAWRVVAQRDGAEVEVKATAIDASQAQALHITAVIAASLQAGRPAEAHAILLRTRGRMRLYARALEAAGIPYDTDFPGGLYESQECHDLEAVLRLCINPHDRRALAIALGGPWGAADPQDRRLLVAALEQEPAAGWAWAAARTPLGALVAEVRVVLADEGVAAALRALGADPRVAARYALLPLARRRLANLARLAEEEVRAGIALDAPAFVARLAERRRLGVDAEEAGGEDLGSRGVRLLTIHQAKGLEWPVVFLPDCQRPFDRRDLTARVLALPAEEGLHLACHPGVDDGEAEDPAPISLAAGVLADERRLRLLAEEARLFYVACTRAREELHALCAGPQATGPLGDLSVRCYADWFAGAGTPWREAVVDLDAPPQAAPRAQPEQGELPALATAQPADEMLVRSVTDLLAEEGPAASRGGSGARARAQELGTALHDALARYEPGMARAQAEVALAPFRAGLDAARAQRLLRSLTDPELIPGYRRARSVLREQPVIGTLPDADGALVVGVCDVLVQDEDGAWWIYDYKSGGAADEAAAAQQVRRYAALLAPHLSGPIAGMAIVDLESGELRAVAGA